MRPEANGQRAVMCLCLASTLHRGTLGIMGLTGRGGVEASAGGAVSGLRGEGQGR